MSTVVEKEKTEIARLDIFAGDWHAEGDVYQGSSRARWVSEERYEWLPGRHFLASRWQADIGGHPFEGQGIFGHDEKRGYFAHFYDNGGHRPEYRLSVDGSRWTFSGEAQRAVYEFSADGASYKIHWDTRKDGGDWQPLCDLTARRVLSPADAVRACFAAYEAQNRTAIELLFGDDFRFTSPRDAPIDKAEWFKRCWPSRDRVRDFRIERLCEHDGEVFVRYSVARATDGVRFRNTEHMRVSRGQIRQVDVYFGRDF